MSFVTYPSDKIADLLKVLHSGIAFYQEGIEAVSCESTRAMFSRMLKEKQQACIDLKPYADENVKESDSALCLDARKLYTCIVSSMTNDAEHTFIEQLTSLERRVLQSFDDALKEEQSQHCAQLLRRVRTRMLQCYDELQSLQQSKNRLVRDRA